MKITKQADTILQDAKLLERANQSLIEQRKITHSLTSEDIKQATDEFKKTFLHSPNKSITKTYAAWCTVAVQLLVEGKIPKKLKSYPKDSFATELNQGYWHGGVEYFKGNLRYSNLDKYYYLNDVDKKTVLKALAILGLFK